MFTRIIFSLGLLAMLVAISCDRVPLLAPTNSTVTLDAGSRVVETGGTTSVSATVIEQAGTPVQNGTTVRFTTTLGRVDPAEAQTRNGIATTTFFAGSDSGIAEVRATSGGAGGSSSTTTPTTPTNGNGTTTPTTTATNSNVVLISVGSAAVETVTVRANPSSVSSNGGTVALIATVVGTGGRLLPNIPVSFSASRGTLSATTAATDAQGEARVTLNTNGDTDISVAAGTKTATTKITGQPGPAVTLSCAVGTANCSNVNPGQSVVFTAQRGGTTSSIASSSLDFGDGSNPVSLGSLASAATVPHVYSQAGTYTARLTATDVNGETTDDVEVVQVIAQTLVVGTTKVGLAVTATAMASATVTQYQWDFGDGFTANTTTNSQAHTYAAGGTYTIRVTALLSGGGSVNGNTSVTVP